MDQAAPSSNNGPTKRKWTPALNSEADMTKAKKIHDENQSNLEYEEESNSSITSYESNDWEEANIHEKDKNVKNVNNFEFGHRSLNCFKKVKCLKCAEYHSTTDCKIEVDAKYSCVNCKGEHKAHSLNCPVFVKYTNRLATYKSAQNGNVDINHKHHSPPVTGTTIGNSPLTYAEAAGNSPNIRSNNTNPGNERSNLHEQPDDSEIRHVNSEKEFLSRWLALKRTLKTSNKYTKFIMIRYKMLMN
ncbi:hypothetical protein PV327_011348 [Microctonus hyperodae]|uniref:Uncharacterized protein n=1 Tax=Microctonus hyperodae TaxID=165561 RepID=A0AA39ESL0_MICHY|nr:hypothetical protein PV327_011348 [Microctonus hyperodae]